MKKQDKIDLLKRGIENQEICRCFYTYAPSDYYTYIYPNAVNEKFILGQHEDDFILDGYRITKVSHLKKIQIKNDKCNEINGMLGIKKQIKMPDVDITNWEMIFRSLQKYEGFITIEDEINEKFAIGVIDKVLKKKLYFSFFDADGIWDEDGLEIPYSQITTVQWGDRYARGWEKYMELRKK